VLGGLFGNKPSITGFESDVYPISRAQEILTLRTGAYKKNGVLAAELGGFYFSDNGRTLIPEESLTRKVIEDNKF
jgi:hypothetical protein